MNRKNFEPFVGKPVDLFLIPNIEYISGTVNKCEDDYIVIGDELWSYQAILGIRPQAKPSPRKNEAQKKNVPEAVKNVPEVIDTPQKEKEVAPIHPYLLPAHLRGKVHRRRDRRSAGEWRRCGLHL